MNLYLVKALVLEDDENNPWEPWYDKTFGFVIRASSEEEARQIATETSYGDEIRKIPDAWLSSKYSSCEVLVSEGEAGIILKDFASA